MRDRLRQAWNRPLRDGDRRRLFVLAVAVIGVVAVALALLENAGPTPRERTARSAARPAAPPAAAAIPSATPPADAPNEESRPSPGSHGSARDVAAAKHAARRFLDGYLPYTYGRGARRAHRRGRPKLRAELAKYPPRPPAGQQPRRPRLELLQSNGVGPLRAQLVALIDDTVARYPLHLQLTKTPSGWLVTGLES